VWTLFISCAFLAPGQSEPKICLSTLLIALPATLIASTWIIYCDLALKKFLELSIVFTVVGVKDILCLLCHAIVKPAVVEELVGHISDDGL
jgi:hypothetical protein